MEKVKLEDLLDNVDPDHVTIRELNIRCYVEDNDAIAIYYTDRATKFGMPKLFIARSTFHSRIQNAIYTFLIDKLGFDESEVTTAFGFKERHEEYYYRIWESQNIIVSWGDGDVKKELSEIRRDLNNGNFAYVVPDEENPIVKIGEMPFDIDLDKLNYCWTETEEETEGLPEGESIYVNYAYFKPVGELLSSGLEINKTDDSEQRLFHLMTPEEKAEYLKNNDEKRQERINYFKEGEKAWDAKHPGWDPAHYHNTFYQENKDMKIGEKEIRQMVSETVKRILKESYDDTANITLSEFTYCTEKLNRLTYKLQEANNELLSCAKEIIEGLPRYGLAIANVSNELNEYGLTIKGNITITNPDDVDPEDYNLNDSFDYKEYIRNTLDELFYDIKSWKKPKYVEDITFVDNSILIEMDEYNPIRISKNLPDV